MNLLQKFTKWLETDNVEESWKKRNRSLIKVTLEFDDGLIRELSGEAAGEWAKDLHYRNCGRSVNWDRHQFKVTRKD